MFIRYHNIYIAPEFMNNPNYKRIKEYLREKIQTSRINDNNEHEK